MTLLPLAACVLAVLPVQRRKASEDLTSGRPMPPEQACYDVTHYDLDIRVDPDSKSIQGRVEVAAEILEDSDDIELDLDSRMTVSSVTTGVLGVDVHDLGPARFTHKNGVLRVHAPETFKRANLPRKIFVVTVTYAGQPREAPMAPWDGGFVWSKTPSGAPWIATANQMQGADLWWPCKDQPDDEANGVAIDVTVPKPLVCASNGKLIDVQEHGDTRRFFWRVSTPINSYGIALNIAPYETISRDYQSVAGDTFPVTYWVLPENLAKGKVLFEDILRQMRVFEELFGPYPFRADKYGVAETPHLGMEHQTIIAYGNEYKMDRWGEDRGYDELHLHEFAHEWWANLVTCANWKDFWIHESVGSSRVDLQACKLEYSIVSPK